MHFLIVLELIKMLCNVFCMLLKLIVQHISQVGK